MCQTQVIDEGLDDSVRSWNFCRRTSIQVVFPGPMETQTGVWTGQGNSGVYRGWRSLCPGTRLNFSVSLPVCHSGS